MKYKKIMTFFAIAAPLAIFIRTFQVFFTISSNGFTPQRFRDLGYKLTIAILAAVAVSTAFGFITHRCPENLPKKRPVLMAAMILLGVWTIADILIFPLASSVPVWQSISLNLLAILSGVLWIISAVESYIPIKLPRIVFIIPVLFWIVRLIWAFTTLNTLSLTTNYIFLLLAYCAVLIFMLQYAKQINGIDKEYNFKKLLASGICASSLCGVFSIPLILETMLRNNIDKAGLFSSIITLFVNGLFILTFTISHFSNSNLKKRRRRRHHTRLLKIDKKVDRFYTGD